MNLNLSVTLDSVDKILSAISELRGSCKEGRNGKENARNRAPVGPPRRARREKQERGRNGLARKKREEDARIACFPLEQDRGSRGTG